MLWIGEPTAVLEWDPDGPSPDPDHYVTIPVANMVPDPLRWLYRFCRAACTPPVLCYVLLPQPRSRPVPNEPEDVPPPDAGSPPPGHWSPDPAPDPC